MPSVDSFDGRRRWSEHGRRLDPADGFAAGVVAEGADVAVRAERPVGLEPGRAPAEARQAEPLQPLRERPQLVEPEWFGGPRDEVFAHRA